MPSVQNKLPEFQVLCLPNRTLRFEGKEIKELTYDELLSNEFKTQSAPFRVVEAPVPVEIPMEIPLTEPFRPVTETPTKKRSKRRFDTNQT